MGTRGHRSLTQWQSHSPRAGHSLHLKARWAPEDSGSLLSPPPATPSFACVPHYSGARKGSGSEERAPAWRAVPGPVAGEFRCEGGRGRGTLRSELFLPGERGGCVTSTRPSVPRATGRSHGTAGSRARGERAAPACVPAPVPPPSLPARPCAAPVPRAARSQTQAGQRGWHCRGSRRGPGARRAAARAAGTGTPADTGERRRGRADGGGAGWGLEPVRAARAARGREAEASRRPSSKRTRGRERAKETAEAALAGRIIGKGPGRQ